MLLNRCYAGEGHWISCSRSSWVGSGPRSSEPYHLKQHRSLICSQFSTSAAQYQALAARCRAQGCLAKLLSTAGFPAVSGGGKFLTLLQVVKVQSTYKYDTTRRAWPRKAVHSQPIARGEFREGASKQRESNILMLAGGLAALFVDCYSVLDKRSGVVSACASCNLCDGYGRGCTAVDCRLETVQPGCLCYAAVSCSVFTSSSERKHMISSRFLRLRPGR